LFKKSKGILLIKREAETDEQVLAIICKEYITKEFKAIQIEPLLLEPTPESVENIIKRVKETQNN
jgi:hypothetical protein